MIVFMWNFVIHVFYKIYYKDFDRKDGKCVNNCYKKHIIGDKREIIFYIFN